ncbi:hypothetical protein L7F22_052111 [Adiantum nelumboides]|nr:hypothetical protein [Adiantum nelumboides]
MHFQKSARQWWASLRANGEAPKTWKALRASIMKQFLASDAKDKVLTEWRSLKLSPYESIHKYVDKFWDLHLKSIVYKKIDFEEQKQQFCAGLPEDMNEYVNSQRPRSISAVIHHTMVAARINFQQGAKRNIKPMEAKEKQEYKGKNFSQNSSKGNSNNNKTKEKGVFKGKNKLTPEELERYRKENKCFKCGEQGHSYRSCPQRNPRNEQPRASMVEASKEQIAPITSRGMESTNLEGEVPASLFSPLNLTSVFLGYNSLNGTLNLQSAGPLLTDVELPQNRISSLNKGSFSGTLNLQGNLICEDHGVEDAACNPAPRAPPAASAPSACGCSGELGANPATTPGTCLCSLPVSGALIFIALRVSLDSGVIPTIQAGFKNNIPLVTSQNQVSIKIVSRLVANISIFPNNAKAWDIQQANLITALISSKAISFPTVGPYEYSPYGPYIPPGAARKKGKLSGGVKIGLGLGVTALAALLACICGYAFLQKRRADKAEEVSKPFASWGNPGLGINGAPKVKGARMFSLSEMKKATSNFSKANEIGAGGYGKVYKGVLPSGEKVAIKKAQASSQQGGGEFTNEIELLSRVHHRNLVGLVGFCFEEQMLVYEFMPNGTLRDSLSGRTKVKMDWYTRLSVALGSARGLAYLHSEADPPIIHRDVKSSNILLDEKLNAKVADFGLSKLAPDDEGTGQGHVSTQVKGTLVSIQASTGIQAFKKQCANHS